MLHKSVIKESVTRGMAPSAPLDAKPELKHHYLQNVRITQDGALESRPRLSDFLSFPSVNIAHSVKKLVDKALTISNYIAGVGTELYTGAGPVLALKASGFSGNPLAIVNFRPEESLETYAYIADEDKMVKVSASDVLSDIGITPPSKAIIWQLLAPARKIIDNVNTATEPDWVVTNGVKSVVGRVNTTVSQYLADGALPNYVSIIPAAFSQDIQPGAILTINGDERVVEEVVSTGLAAGVATIAAITYEAGAAGVCHITLSVPVTEIYRNSILLLNGTEYVRVIDVTRGSDGIPVIKTSTVGTFAVGNTVQGFASFRIYTTSSYVSPNVIFAEGVKNAIAATGVSTLTKTANYDLSFAGTEPLSEDALVHISLKIADLSLINEIQIQLAFDTGFVDYIYFPISPNFLAANISQDASAVATIQSASQRREILRLDRSNENIIYSDMDRTRLDELYENQFIHLAPSFDSTVGETALGTNVWTEVAVPFKRFTRVGSDSSKTRKDIKAVKIVIDATAATDVVFDSIWVGGASGMDSVGSVEEVLFPYNYVYRFRDPATRAVSNPSPPLREGILTKRKAIGLSIPANAHPVSYKVDIIRIGGSLNDWHIVASIPNDGTTFRDDVSDDLVADNEKIGRASTEFSVGDFDYFKPFAILDRPKSGVCNVVGTELTIVSGDNLDTSYAAGTKIMVGGRLTQFYSNPSSATRVSLKDNLGTVTNEEFEIKEPLLTGKPLPIMAGTYKGVIFGAGDINAPGTAYWLDPNSPDTMSDVNRIEISNPNEPIMAIVIYDNYPFVYTTQRSFTLKAYNNNGYLDFDYDENANSKGLISRYGICVARTFIYQLAEDGIYRSEGVGNPQSITDTDLHSFFPHNGIAPSPIVISGITIYPPDYTKISEMRLHSTEDHIFWRFIDTNNKQVCLVFDTRLEGWISLDKYLDDKVGAIYKEEGEGDTSIIVGTAGKIRKFADVSSNEDGLETFVVPFAEDFGNFRTLKKFYSVSIDCIAGATFSVFTSFDDFAFTITTIVPLDTDRNLTTIEILDGDGLEARNIINIFKWLLNSGTVLFRHGIYYEPTDSAVIFNEGTEFGDDILDKFWQGWIVEADTFGEDKEVEFLDDDGDIVATIIINHDGKIIKPYSFELPFISHKVTRKASDGVAWIVYQEKFIYDREPELVDVWESQRTSHGLNGYKQIKTPTIAVAATTTVRVILTIDNNAPVTYNIPASGGIKKSYSLQIAAAKWNLIKYRLESDSPFRLYKKDCEVWIREWNSQNDFQAIKPFGVDDNITEVQI